MVLLLSRTCFRVRSQLDAVTTGLRSCQTSNSSLHKRTVGTFQREASDKGQLLWLPLRLGRRSLSVSAGPGKGPEVTAEDREPEAPPQPPQIPERQTRGIYAQDDMTMAFPTRYKSRQAQKREQREKEKEEKKKGRGKGTGVRIVGSGEFGMVGALQSVPQIPMADEILATALKRAARVRPKKKDVSSPAQRERVTTSMQLDALTKQFTVPLRDLLAGFPRVDQLHPFEQALLELTVGQGRYTETIKRVQALRKTLHHQGKEWATRAAKSQTRSEAQDLRTEGFEALADVYACGQFHVDSLKEVSKHLRRLPVVEPEVPTVVLVGAPNVGKSSLVRVLSSGEPEVQNYPFTTRGIKLGHMYLHGDRQVVTDTPGLLNRADEERNSMERLTLAALEHLRTSVIFVTDLTAICGTSVQDQFAIRRELRRKFPQRPWVDVLSKSDLLDALAGGGMDSATWQRLMPEGGPTREEALCSMEAARAEVPHALKVSVVNDEGMEELKANLVGLVFDEFYTQNDEDSMATST